MRDVIRRRRWRDDEDAMSLVEVMIAVFVLGVGLLALASTAITSIVNIRVSRGRQEATDAASALIEDLRRTDYTSVALDEGDALVQDFVTDNGGCDPGYQEPLVTTDQPGGIAREQSFGPSGRVTVRTSVSWYDENDDNGCLDATHDTAVKRVQVVATWVDGDRTYTVEESTLVAPVDRGLPAPDFRVGTPTAALNFTADDVTNEREQCVGHVVRNLGAEDSYEIHVDRTDGTINEAGRWGYYAPDGNHWTVRAFLTHPPQDPPVSPATLGITPTHSMREISGHPEMELLYDDVGDGNTWRESVTDLATGEHARLWVCFRAGDQLADGETASFETTIYSRFDPNRFETIQHEVGVSNTFVDYYLYDDYDAKNTPNPTTVQASTPRVVKVKGTWMLSVLSMGPQTSIQPELLGTTPQVPNYDTDFDGYPGTRLLDSQRLGESSDPDWPASTIAFDQQMETDTTFAGGANLTLWSASESALQAQATGAATVTPRTLRYGIQLQVLADDESTVLGTPFTGSITYSHAAVGWSQLTASLPTSSFPVPADGYLRLRITCDTAGDSDPATDTCHLGYDHQSVASVLRLAVQS